METRAGNRRLVVPKGSNPACSTPKLKACDGGWGLVSLKVTKDQYVGWLITGTVLNVNSDEPEGVLRIQLFDRKGKLLTSAIGGAVNTPKGGRESTTFSQREYPPNNLKTWTRAEFSNYIG